MEFRSFRVRCHVINISVLFELTIHSFDIPRIGDKDIQLAHEGSHEDLPICDKILPLRPDFTDTVLETGFKIVTRIRQYSHADVYAAQDVHILQRWYEVKVFSICVDSPKQNRYQKRTFKISLAQ